MIATILVSVINDVRVGVYKSVVSKKGRGREMIPVFFFELLYVVCIHFTPKVYVSAMLVD